MSNTNQLLALTYIQAVADEDEEQIENILETISPKDLAHATAKIAEVFAIAVSQFSSTPDGEELTAALERLRNILTNDE